MDHALSSNGISQSGYFGCMRLLRDSGSQFQHKLIPYESRKVIYSMRRIKQNVTT